MSNYATLLRDPRWQRRRLEMLEKAGFKCEQCDCACIELHVHHKKYIAGRNPWEYSDSELIVLCKDCHEVAHIPAPSLHDIERESRLAALNREFTQEPDERKQRQIWAAIVAVHRERSLGQIVRLERARGLR